jgi:hypothetical protein
MAGMGHPDRIDGSFNDQDLVQAYVQTGESEMISRVFTGYINLSHVLCRFSYLC